MKKYFVIQIVAIALLMWFVPIDVLAATTDERGMALYKRLMHVGKYTILIKGAVDTIQNVMEGNYQAARTNFMGYLLCFAILLVLPMALDETEAAFGY